MVAEGGARVPADMMARFRRGAAVTVSLAVIGYVAYAVWTGLSATKAELAAFHWNLYIAVLGLTLVNYGVRYVKWVYLLSRLDVRVPTVANAWIFLAGLAMVISPGKAGELLKPYLVRVVSGAPMTRTVPVLVAERGTDGLAVVALAALGVGTYYSDGITLIATTLAIIVVGLVVIASRPLSLGLIGLVRRVPFLAVVADRLEAAYTPLRICLSPVSFAVTMTLSFIAWWAECIGYWLVFRGLGVPARLEAATFLYAFATVFGAPSPGGVGMADGVLGEGAAAAIPGISGPQAVAAALLIRVATLWFGVILGGIALLRMESMIRRYGTTEPESEGPPPVVQSREA